MVKIKSFKIAQGLMFLYFILFPFGQIFRLNLNLPFLSLTVHPADIVVFLGVCSLFFIKPRISFIYKSFVGFWIVCLFSFLLSFGLFGLDKGLLQGGLYLVRLAVYFSFPLLAFNLAVKKPNLRESFLNYLLVVVVMTAFFGWVQYFFFPDLRPLYYFGWDEHLFRLTGGFLDPGFIGIILVFGYIISLLRFFESKKEIVFLVLAIFFVLTIGFTYSRATYLGLFAATTAIFVIKKKLKPLLLFFLAFVFFAFLLPRPGGEGVNLLRTRSISDRVNNYFETTSIFLKSPVLGVGFNNICLARVKFLGVGDFSSHACSGSDSSLLLILATTGIVGIFTFLGVASEITKNLRDDIYGNIATVSLVSLAVHSVFVNSLFYPWVMGFIGVLIALGSKGKKLA